MTTNAVMVTGAQQPWREQSRLDLVSHRALGEEINRILKKGETDRVEFEAKSSHSQENRHTHTHPERLFINSREANVQQR